MPLGELIPLVGIPAYFIIGSLIFFGRGLLKGFPKTARFEKMGKAKVVPRIILEYGNWMLMGQVRLFMALGITANLMTMISLALAVLGAIYLGMGRFGLGGWLMFYSFFCDAFDGMIARASGTASDRGEYLDAFIDRYADCVTSFGFLYYYRNDPIPAFIVAAGLAGATAMGYARAKGEAVGIDPNVGVMQRHERAVFVGCSTVLAPIFSAFFEPGSAHPIFYTSIVAQAFVAVLSNVSAIWRAVYVLNRMPKKAQPRHSAPAIVVEEPAAASHGGVTGAPASSLEPDTVRS